MTQNTPPPPVGESGQPQIVYVQQPPKKKGKGCLIALAVLVGLAILGGILGSLGGGNEAADPAPGATDTAAATGADDNTQAAKETKKSEAPKKEAPANKMGAPVRSGDLEFTVSGYKCGVSVEDVTGELKPQGQFCKVDVLVKNVGKKQEMVTDDQIKLIGAEGVEYKTSSETWMAEGAFLLKEINPGNSLKGTAYFDIPTDAKPHKISVKGDLFSKAQEIPLS